MVDELAGMRPRRVAELRALTAGGADPLVPTPFGERPLSAGLPVRVFDLWAHEQDIRRAMGRAPRISGLGAEVSLDRVLAMWPRALPPAMEGVDGELAIEVTGPEPSTLTIPLGASGPTATLRGDLGDITRVFCGRVRPGDDLLTGDPALVEALRKVVPCYAFTNTNASHMATWSKLFPGVVGAFDRIFASHELGLRKPEPAAFERVCRLAGVAAASTLFFDDLPHNVQAAQQFGLQAVLVRSPNDVAHALRAVGLDPQLG